MATYTTSITGGATVAASARQVLPATAATPLTSVLVGCGIVFGPLFYVVAIIQMAIRPGFDLRRHAISLLSLGDLGWIQITNFAVTGVLAILCAIGLRLVLQGGIGGTWGPVLIGVSGLAMVTAAIFHPDPGLSFPPGAPADMPASMSWHAALHMLAFCLAFLSLLAACFIFARRFASQGHSTWGIYSVATGVVSLVFIILGMSNKHMVGVFMAVGVAVVFAWVAAIAAHSLTESVPLPPRQAAANASVRSRQR
jgi:hypothetical membrane protein